MKFTEVPYFILKNFFLDNPSMMWHEPPPVVQTYTLITSAGANGQISPDGTINVLEGMSLKFDFIAKDDYNVENVIINGVSIGSLDTYTIENIRENYTIAATFTEEPFYNMVSTVISGNGTVSPLGSVQYQETSNVTYTFTPSSDSIVSMVLVDGEYIIPPPQVSYTFIDIYNNHTIDVAFDYSPIHIITSSVSGGNGNITPLGNTEILRNGSQTYTFIPSAGYQVDRVIVDNEDV